MPYSCCLKKFNKVSIIISFLLLMTASSVTFSAPTPEQIQVFKSLPKSQQEALLKQQGIQLPSTNSTIQNPQPIVDTVKKKPSPPKAVQKVQVETLKTDQALSTNKNASALKKRNISLKRFGEDLFSGSPTTFAPVNDIPVPSNYVLGPGDQIKLQLYGNKSDQYTLVINRNGQLDIPGLPPITIAGLPLSKAFNVLQEHIKNLGVGVKANITLGALRSYRVFVLGESNNPGTYLVSGLSTISHALYVSGGINKIGSLRNIQLKRQGKLIATLDLYDFLIKGDTQNDKRLLPGDTVFIPPVKKQVSIAGEVNRPAIYEIKSEKTVKQLLQLAGGIKPTAYLSATKLSRVSKQGYRTVLDLDLTKKQDLGKVLQNGDIVTIQALRPVDDASIILSGEVFRHGKYQWHSGIKLLDVLPNREKFTESADLHYIVIKRQPVLRGNFQAITVNWEEALNHPNGSENISLLPRDEIYVLNRSNAEERKNQIAKLNTALYKQATLQEPPQVVSVMGRVKFPGKYPLTKKMHIKELINASGNLDINAMINEADIIRFSIIDGEKREVDRITFNLAKAMEGNTKHNIALKPYDQLIVKQVSDWNDSTRTITLKGEVKYPGKYIIRPGETLEDVLERAGGFTEWAAPQNAVFLRKALKEQEQREYQALANELQKNLLLSAKQNVGLNAQGSDSTVMLGNALIEKIKQTPALGRLVISLDPQKEQMYQASLAIEVRDGDTLVIPKRSNEVVVMGEVARSVSLLYQPDHTLTDYLNAAGGATQRADTSQIYVVHGDGSIQSASIGWFSHNSVNIKPGDTIVVPMDVGRINPLITWSSVSKILANFAVTAATLKTVGVIN